MFSPFLPILLKSSWPADMPLSENMVAGANPAAPGEAFDTLLLEQMTDVPIEAFQENWPADPDASLATIVSEAEATDAAGPGYAVPAANKGNEQSAENEKHEESVARAVSFDTADELPAVATGTVITKPLPGEKHFDRSANLSAPPNQPALRPEQTTDRGSASSVSRLVRLNHAAPDASPALSFDAPQNWQPKAQLTTVNNLIGNLPTDPVRREESNATAEAVSSVNAPIVSPQPSLVSVQAIQSDTGLEEVVFQIQPPPPTGSHGSDLAAPQYSDDRVFRPSVPLPGRSVETGIDLSPKNLVQPIQTGFDTNRAEYKPVAAATSMSEATKSSGALPESWQPKPGLRSATKATEFIAPESAALATPEANKQARENEQPRESFALAFSFDSAEELPAVATKEALRLPLPAESHYDNSPHPTAQRNRPVLRLEQTPARDSASSASRPGHLDHGAAGENPGFSFHLPQNRLTKGQFSAQLTTVHTLISNLPMDPPCDEPLNTTDVADPIMAVPADKTEASLVQERPSSAREALLKETSPAPTDGRASAVRVPHSNEDPTLWPSVPLSRKPVATVTDMLPMLSLPTVQAGLASGQPEQKPASFASNSEVATTPQGSAQPNFVSTKFARLKTNATAPGAPATTLIIGDMRPQRITTLTQPVAIEPLAAEVLPTPHRQAKPISNQASSLAFDATELGNPPQTAVVSAQLDRSAEPGHATPTATNNPATPPAQISLDDYPHKPLKASVAVEPLRLTFSKVEQHFSSVFLPEVVNTETTAQADALTSLQIAQPAVEGLTTPLQATDFQRELVLSQTFSAVLAKPAAETPVTSKPAKDLSGFNEEWLGQRLIFDRLVSPTGNESVRTLTPMATANQPGATLAPAPARKTDVALNYFSTAAKANQQPVTNRANHWLSNGDISRQAEQNLMGFSRIPSVNEVAAAPAWQMVPAANGKDIFPAPVGMANTPPERVISSASSVRPEALEHEPATKSDPQVATKLALDSLPGISSAAAQFETPAAASSLNAAEMKFTLKRRPELPGEKTGETATVAQATLAAALARGIVVAQQANGRDLSDGHVTQQLAETVIAASSELVPHEPRTIRVKLRPDNLGEVEIELKRDAAGRFTAQLRVEREHTQQVLRNELGQLRDTLEQAGLQFGRLDVTTNVEQHTQGWHAGGQAAQHDAAPIVRIPEPDSPALEPRPTGGASAATDRLINLHA